MFVPLHTNNEERDGRRQPPCTRRARAGFLLLYVVTAELARADAGDGDAHRESEGDWRDLEESSQSP